MPTNAARVSGCLFAVLCPPLLAPGRLLPTNRQRARRRTLDSTPSEAFSGAIQFRGSRSSMPRCTSRVNCSFAESSGELTCRAAWSYGSWLCGQRLSRRRTLTVSLRSICDLRNSDAILIVEMTVIFRNVPGDQARILGPSGDRRLVESALLRPIVGKPTDRKLCQRSG